MYEMYAKFHQNWWCGFREKWGQQTDICGFIYRMALIRNSKPPETVGGLALKAGWPCFKGHKLN